MATQTKNKRFEFSPLEKAGRLSRSKDLWPILANVGKFVTLLVVFSGSVVEALDYTGFSSWLLIVPIAAILIEVLASVVYRNFKNRR